MKQTSLVAQKVKRLPTMRKTQVQSLGREDTLEKEMATHSSTLAWKIPWMEEHGRLQSMGSQRVRNNWATSLCFALLQSVIRKQNKTAGTTTWEREDVGDVQRMASGSRFQCKWGWVNSCSMLRISDFTISRQSEWLRSKSLQAINSGEGVEKREPSYTVGGNAN